MNLSLRDGLMATFERIASEPDIDWYMAFKLLRSNIAIARDAALDDALVKALFALELRNTVTCTQCIALQKRCE